MAEDANARIRVDIDTAAALANIKNLQRQISAFHTSMAKGGAAAAATSLNMQQGLLNSINQTGKFSATIRNVKSTTDSFTDSLQKNKLSMGEYFRYAGASTKTFGRLFRSEFDTINKVARERVKDLQTQYIKMGRDANGAMRAIAVRPLALDMENLATRTQIAAQRQALLNQLLKQGSTNLLNFGKNTQWAGRQLMVGFTVPLVMLGSVAAKTFMDMEKQAVRFKRVYGEMFTTSGQTEKALAEIKELANEFTKYGVAVSKTMELAADIAATGKMGAELNAQVAETTRLAILGGVEQAEALQATISLTDAFGVSADELAGKIDFLNAVENQTITSIEDLTIAIPKAGPVVQQLGGDVEDLTFFLTAMREGGINASEGANALKSGLAALINPTGTASEMLQGLGINIKSIVEGNAGDVKGLVIDFAKALDGLDPLNRARAIEQLFGKFQFSRLSTLFQNVIKDGNQASRVLKLTNATTAELAILSEREMKKIEDSPMFKFQKALEDIKVTLVPLGEAFLKAVTPLLEFGTSILKKFDELDDGAKSFVVGLTAIAGVIGPVFLMGFGLIANGVANIIKMFVFFKASLNKAGSASTQLGMQTEYMTQQQLEASAVAASLDQVHQKLRQTFTSETAAVNALTAAYSKSIAAQGAMTGGAIGRTRPKLNLASGIMSVPGPRGAGDVVPAMLSPGEAVIPAKQSKKYRGIISSLIADNVPGFRFGRNPFASMLGRSKVAVRMKDSDFSSELAASGKNAKYKSAFDTQTGADYIRPSGSENTRQKELRSAMERDVFGLDPKTTPTSARPTYGYARTPILSSFINKLFGIKGKNFNAVTRNVGEDSLAKYGNIDLVTKGSVAKRSSAFAGDALVNYHWAAEAQSFKRRAADLKVRLTRTGVQPAPMKGASPEQLGSFDRLGSPFKRYDNDAPAYVETYTPGGFKFSEIDKIIARDPVIAKRLKDELRAAGLGSVRVTGSNFAARLFKQMGVPGYSDGTTSIDFDRTMTTQMAHMSEGRDNLTEKEIKRLAGKEISRLIASGTYDRLGISPQQDIDHIRNNTSGANSLYAGRLEPVLTVSNQGTANRDALRSGATYLSELKGLPRGVFGSGILATIDAAKASGARIDIPNRDLVRYMRNVRKAYESELKKNHGRMLRESDNNKLYENATKTAISKITNPNIQSKFKDLVAYSSAMLTPASPNTGSDSGNTRRYQPRKDIQKILRSISSSGGSLGKLLGPNFEREYSSRILDKTKISVPRDVKDSIVSLREQLSKKDMANLSRSLINASYERDKTARFEGYRNVLRSASSGNFGVIPPTGGSPRPSAVKRTGGTPQDTRLLLTKPGETVLSEKSTNSIRQGGIASVPGIGRMGRFGPMPMRVAGAFEGVPGGQTQGPSYTGKLAPPKFDPMSVSPEQTPSTPSQRKEFGNAIGAGFGKAREVTKALAASTTSVIKNVVVGDIDKNTGLLGKLGRSAAIGLGNLGGNRVVDSTGKVLTGPEAGAAKSAAAAGSNSAIRNTPQPPIVAGGARQQLDPDDPNSRRGIMSGKVAGAASAVGMGAMMYGMSGGPGAEIAGMLSLPLMMAPMLTNKFALMAAAIVGLVAGFVILQNVIAGVRKESAETARSLSSGKEAMAKFAEMAGTVTPSEYMNKRREMELSPFIVQTGKTTFGQSFVQSESGIEMLEAFEKQTEAFGRSRAIESLQKQLVTAIATGVLSKEQAQSIAQSLGQKLDDYGITANINAAINSIVGPDGKVLQGNTIQIYTEFIEGSTSGVTGTGGILQNQDLTDNGSSLWWWDTERVAKREGEAAGIIANFYDENQQLIDAFDAENLKRIDVLYDQGKYDEALAAEEAYQKQRAELIGSYNQKTAELVSGFGEVDFNNQQGILAQLAAFATETDAKSGEAARKLQQSTAILGTNTVTGIDYNYQNRLDTRLPFTSLNEEEEAKGAAFQQVKVQLLGELTGGNISTDTFNGLMEMFDPSTGEGQGTLTLLTKISTEVGPQALTQLQKVFAALDNPDLAAEIAVSIEEITDPKKTQGTINALEQLATFDGTSIEADVMLEFFGAEENFGKLDELQEKFTELDKMAKEGKLNLTTLVEQNVITTGDMDALIEDQAFFDGLEPEQQVKYLQVFLSKQEVEAVDEIKAWRSLNPELSSRFSDDQVADRIANAAAKQYVEENLFTDTSIGDDEDSSSGGGSSGPQASSLDDLLKKLRDLRKNQIGLTKGFEASAAAINKLFGGGAGINLFSGIENDMRRLGAEEDLISLIVGMDPEEFEKQKNTLFNFDRQTGEIVGFKDQLQSVGRALSAIALGQYVSDQQRSAKESRNQVLAFNQLRAAGYSVAEAYETVQDAAVASAVATGNVTRDQLGTMLQELRNAESAMKQAARLTPEGLQEVFEEGFNKAMEAFEAQENKLTLEYELKIADDQKLIKDAQNQIAAIQYAIDDYEADLKGIEDQEEAINKTYDEKLEALEKVRKANQKVLDQEKGKLSVAEAITRGDLAAAARAVQDVRATSASGYFSSQTDALNAGRQSALDAVRGENKLSRIEIEERIEQLANQIFEIEENTLEPATERVRLAGIELQSRIDEYEVLGKTKTEWETIKNSIDVARVNSAGYKSAMDEALAVVQDVLDAWNEIEKPKETIHTIITVREGDASDSNLGNDGYGDGDEDETEIDTPAVAAAKTALTEAQNALATWDAKKAELGRQLTAAQTGYASAVGSDKGLYQRTIDGIKKQLSYYDSSDRKLYLNAITYAQNQLSKAQNLALGGFVSGPGTGTSDSIPAMLSNGEYVIKASTVKQFGTKLFDNINAGSLPTLSSAQNMSAPRFASVGSSASVSQASVPSRQAAASSSNSVYNYSLSVNVASQSDPNTIAQTVMNQLRMVDSQRIRGNRF
jgi:TP901 family phage tail tape measure protein